MPRTTSVFAILCACDCTERFETWKVFFEFTYFIKKKDLAPRPLKFTLFTSSMHVRAFIMLLLWSKKEYGLLKSNLWRLGLRGFSNNGLNFSFNCLLTSNILWVENDTWQKIIKVGFMLRTCERRVSQYSRINCLKGGIPIIEYTSCICGDEVLHAGRRFAP